MSKTVTIEITKCYKCPYFGSNDLGVAFTCWCDIHKDRRHLDYLNMEIPDWCPLPEKKDGL